MTDITEQGPRGGVELPEAAGWMNKNGDMFSKKEAVGFNTSTMKPLYTHDRLLAYGAAQRLAGREQVLKEATDLDWTAIMCEGCLVTWENAETLGCHAVEHIRALAASPQEQT